MYSAIAANKRNTVFIILIFLAVIGGLASLVAWYWDNWAIAIGTLAAGGSYAAMQLRARTRVDDALDVFACHGVAGIAGALLTGVFATTAVNPAGADGLLAGNAAQLGVQAIAVAATVALAGAGTAVIVLAIKAVMRVRVHVADEIGGVDASEHGEHAYHGEALGELAGAGASIGESVLIAASDVAPRVRAVG